MVDVFGVGAGFFEPGGIAFCAVFDFVESGERLFYFGGSEDADGFEGFGPSAVDGDFVGQQAAIKCKRALERVEARVWFAFEAAAPEAIVFAVSHGGSCQSSVFSFRTSGAKTQWLRSFGPPIKSSPKDGKRLVNAMIGGDSRDNKLCSRTLKSCLRLWLWGGR